MWGRAYGSLITVAILVLGSNAALLPTFLPTSVYGQAANDTGHDGSLSVDRRASGPDSVVHVLLEDQDLNYDSNLIDEVPAGLVVFYTNNDAVGSASPRLEETGVNTNRFAFDITLVSDPNVKASGGDNPKIGVSRGQVVTIEYQDQFNSRGAQTNVLTVQIVIALTFGSLELVADRYDPADTVRGTVVDRDMDKDTRIVDSVEVRYSSDSDPVGGSVLASETSSSTGAFVFDLPLTEAKDKTALQVKAGDTVTFEYDDIGADGVETRVSDQAVINTIKVKPETFTVTTDKQLYVFGDRITISGTILRFSENKDVFISINYNDETLFYSTRVTPIVSEETREISYRLELPSTMFSAAGTYLVHAGYSGGEALTRFELTIPSDRPTIQINSDKSTYVSNEEVKISGSIVPPPPNATLYVTNPRHGLYSKEELEINSDGDFSTTVLLPMNASGGSWTAGVTTSDHFSSYIIFEIIGEDQDESKVIKSPWSELTADAVITMLDEKVSIITLKNSGDKEIRWINLKTGVGSILYARAEGWDTMRVNPTETVLTNNALKQGGKIDIVLVAKDLPSDLGEYTQHVTSDKGISTSVVKPIGLNFDVPTPPEPDLRVREKIPEDYTDPHVNPPQVLPLVDPGRYADFGEGYDKCEMSVVLLGVNFTKQDFCYQNQNPHPNENNNNDGAILPEWIPVKGFESQSVIVEGKVVEGVYSNLANPSKEETSAAPHVSFKDMGLNHFTHDFTFFVQPNESYMNISGVREYDNEGIPTKRSPSIEVEWESGLGAANDNNICTELNQHGKSCGFYTAGHELRDTIWNWPTVDDTVHVEGQWIWDRGHPPLKSEIHPPRLVAVQRHLPANIAWAGDDYPPDFEDAIPVNPDNTEFQYYMPVPVPGGTIKLPKPEPQLSTRADIFASGDGNVFYNNRTPPMYSVISKDQPPCTRFCIPELESFQVRTTPIKMSEKDYEFDIYQLLPRPSSTAQLKWATAIHKGDTFPLQAVISVSYAPYFSVPEMVSQGQILWKPHVHVVIPWTACGVECDDAVFARTIYLYWDDPTGNAIWGTTKEYYDTLQVYRLSMDRIQILDNMDSADPCWVDVVGIFAIPFVLALLGGLIYAIPVSSIFGTLVIGQVLGEYAGAVGYGFMAPYKMTGCEPDGEYRIFYEVAGKWFFMNEFMLGDDKVASPGILDDGLGDTGEGDDCDISLNPFNGFTYTEDPCWPFERPELSMDKKGGRQFVVYVPVGQNFKIHVDGWEADGMDRLFGHLIDRYPFGFKDPLDGRWVVEPQITKSQLQEWVQTQLFNPESFERGGPDDPVGEINIEWTNVPGLSSVTGGLLGVVINYNYPHNPFISCSQDPGLGLFGPSVCDRAPPECQGHETGTQLKESRWDGYIWTVNLPQCHPNRMMYFSFEEGGKFSLESEGEYEGFWKLDQYFNMSTDPTSAYRLDYSLSKVAKPNAP